MPRKPTDSSDSGRTWKVGELAERTGLTVRTLHHYDALGLLKPSGRSQSTHGCGHRLYTTRDVGRLQQILSLRHLGFALEPIREYLSRPDFDPRRVVRMHLERVRGQAAEMKRLEDRLEAFLQVLEKAGIVSADEFLKTIQEITMIEKYYTPEQLEMLDKRRREAGEAGEEVIRQAPNQWAELQACVQAAMDEGVEPTDPRAQDLARRWLALVEAFTGGDPGIFQSLKRMYQNEDNIRGMDVAAMRPMMAWIEKASAAAGIKHPGS